MRQRWIQFDWSIAVVLSAMLHTGLMYWMLHEQIRALAGLLSEGVTSQSMAYRRQDDDELGRVDGSGTAIASSEGERPASGREADSDQPFLSRDDEGMGHVGDAPSAYRGPTGSGVLAGAMQQPSADNMQPPASFAGRPLVPESAIPIVKPHSNSKPAVATGEEIKPSADQQVEKSPDAPLAPPTPQPDRPAADAPVAAAAASQAVAMNNFAGAPSDARQPGLPLKSADPAPRSDSEIDPFSHNVSVVLRDGKMTVRSGRKYTVTRPRLTLAGRDYLISRGPTSVTLKLTLDEKGKVIHVEIQHSSGSNDIDQPIYLAAHDWTFEPDKDSTGNPQKTTFTITCSYP